MASRVLSAKAERSARRLALILDFIGGGYLVYLGYAFLGLSVGPKATQALGVGGSVTCVAVSLLITVIVMLLVAVSVDMSMRAVRMGIGLAIGGAVPVGVLALAMFITVTDSMVLPLVMFLCWAFAALLYSASYLRHVLARGLQGAE